jgi:hypothetical protein
MVDILNPQAPPDGYKRTRPGWLQIRQSNYSNLIADLKQENADLQDRLAQLEELITSLTPKKRKKEQ